MQHEGQGELYGGYFKKYICYLFGLSFQLGDDVFAVSFVAPVYLNRNRRENVRPYRCHVPSWSR